MPLKAQRRRRGGGRLAVSAAPLGGRRRRPLVLGLLCGRGATAAQLLGEADSRGVAALLQGKVPPGQREGNVPEGNVPGTLGRRKRKRLAARHLRLDMSFRAGRLR